MSNEQCTAVTYGIDLGKTWFHVVGLDPSGSPVKRAKLNRSTITRFFVSARACSMHLDRTKDRLGSWIEQIEGRLHHNKMVVALANKLARIV